MSNEINAEVIHDVVRKLIGEMKPVGSHSIDQERKKNLETHITLFRYLLYELYLLEEYSDDHRASVKEIGSIARNFLEELQEALEESE